MLRNNLHIFTGLVMFLVKKKFLLSSFESIILLSNIKSTSAQNGKLVKLIRKSKCVEFSTRFLSQFTQYKLEHLYTKT